MQLRRWFASPAILVPVVLVAMFGGVMIVAGLLTEDPEAATTDLYASATERAVLGVTPPAATTRPPSVLSSTPTSTPEPASEDAVLLAPPVRVRIERLGIDADLVALGIDSNGNMAAPDKPELVGWYDFTAKPGAGTGNAVLAGHRDWGGQGPAIFWDLADLEHGDTIEVELLDGSVVTYTVTAGHTYPVEGLDMREILARTEQETLTLITCAGDFLNNDYTDRHVVRAVRTNVAPAELVGRWLR